MSACRRLASLSLGLGLAASWALAPQARAKAPIPSGIRGERQPHLINILTQPVSQTVTLGSRTVFTVIADAPGNSDHLLHYQWRKDGIKVGADSSTLIVPAAGLADEGQYTVTITFPAAEVTSATASLTVNAPPAIQDQPKGLTVALGSAAAFSVKASGSGSLGYQWRKDGVDLAGATAPTFTLSKVVATDAGSYSVKVTNTLNGTVTTTLSTGAALVVNVPPVITTQPVTQTQVKGSTVTFTVTASLQGAGQIGYQWRKGGVNLPGATSASLVIPAATAEAAGSYDVVVTNTLNGVITSTTSGQAELAINVPPVITVSPVNQTVDQYKTVNFSVTATNEAGGTLSYQWRKNGDVIPGAVEATLLLQSVFASDAGSYDVVVTNTLNGTTTSTASMAAVLSVHVPPTIQTQPQTQTVLPPDAVTFTVEAKANLGGTLTYQWRKNGVAIEGATGATYTVPSTEFATNADAYTVTVTDGSLSTESASAYAQAQVPSPVFAGDPIPVPNRSLTVLSSFRVDPEKFPNGAFRLGYDEGLKNPVWTSYLNFPVHHPYANSNGDYTVDPRLAPALVGKNDYTGIYTGGANSPTSYDRGHQVPRADVSYRYTPAAGDDATMMSNLVPQISQFNQQTWQRLEEAIGGSQGGTSNGITSFKGRVWVYTGSVFPENHAWWTSAVTPGLKIAIPTACYKIVVSEPTPGQPKALAILMPNVWGLVNSDATLMGYVTSVARIEALTGLDFFPNLAITAPGMDIPTWKATVDVRGWRAPFEQASGPNVHMVQPSWDTTINVNDTLTFEGAATPSAASPTATIAGATWNFGDGSATASGTTATHTYVQGGSFQVSFTAQDSLGISNTITRVIKVKGANNAPTFTGLSNQTGTEGMPLTVKFNVSDDTTPATDLVVNATVDNSTLIPGTLSVVNINGSCTLVLTPAVAQTGSAVVTLMAYDGEGATASATFTVTVNVAVIGFTEGFEKSVKSAYAAATVTLPSGPWNLDDALVGNTTADKKVGIWSARVRNTGKATMMFDASSGAQTVSVLHAKYGTDGNSNWQLWKSVDGGSTWSQVGTDVTTNTSTLQTATFTVNVTAPVRFQIRKISGGSARINFDDFQVAGF